MIYKEEYDMVSDLRELTSQSREADGDNTVCWCWDRGPRREVSTFHRGESGLRRVPRGNSTPSTPARSAGWWESGDQLHRVCELTEMICKILGGCSALGRGSAPFPDSQKLMRSLPKG